MSSSSLNIVILGLSITSSWGNGHATTYRGLIRELARRGHHIDFLERDVPWYAKERDLKNPSYCRVHLYRNFKELRDRWGRTVRDADVVIIGSYVPEGIRVGEWVCRSARGLTAFYDIDTPVTLAALRLGQCDYLSTDLIRKYQLYLSFTGGPTLKRLEKQLGSPCARPLYCSVDPDRYFPETHDTRWHLGYLGTYSSDRQPLLEKLMLSAARSWAGGRFIVAGAQYPKHLVWPHNVQVLQHVPPGSHRRFYNQQAFTLNLTRAAMARAGHSPSVRLFEAAACGVPVISDPWDGLECFFEPGEELLIARDGAETRAYLLELTARDRRKIGQRARRRVLESHTAAHRAAELEQYLQEAIAC